MVEAGRKVNKGTWRVLHFLNLVEGEVGDEEWDAVHGDNARVDFLLVLFGERGVDESELLGPLVCHHQSKAEGAVAVFLCSPATSQGEREPGALGLVLWVSGHVEIPTEEEGDAFAKRGDLLGEDLLEAFG